MDGARQLLTKIAAALQVDGSDVIHRT